MLSLFHGIVGQMHFHALCSYFNYVILLLNLQVTKVSSCVCICECVHVCVQVCLYMCVNVRMNALTYILYK